MNNALSQFQENLDRARGLGGLASAIGTLTTGAIDVSDIWRAQLVLGVSAFDHLIHELARLGMIAIANGSRPKTDAYLRFQMPAAAIDAGLGGAPPEAWMGEAVRAKHSFLSFQQPDTIADALRLVSPVKLWDAVGVEMGLPPEDIKIRLKLVVERRNKIAHEADMDPTNPGFRWPITHALTADAIRFIEDIGVAIHKTIQ